MGRDDMEEVTPYVFDAHPQDTELQFVYGDIQPRYLGTQLLQFFLELFQMVLFPSSFHFATLNLSK